jgi:hypothetical protein
MSRIWNLRVAQVVLLAMIATFVAPGLAWAMITSHTSLEPITHSSAATNHGPSDEHPGSPVHDHDEFHNLIGHVLSHLPLVIVHGDCVVPVCGFAVDAPVLNLPRGGIIEPPVRPPLATSL